MPNLSIDTVNAPTIIKESLHNLSAQITFEKSSNKGANGHLFFGYNRVLNRKMAIKYYYWGGASEYHAEPQRLAQIESEHVVKIYHAELIDQSWAYFITEYCQNGDLDDFLELRPMGLRQALDIIMNLLSGLSYLHGMRFIHRDLKPQNILIGDDCRALIGDFGSVKRIPDGLDEIPGSGHAILYRPPESVTTGQYGLQGDIYQLGIILYQILGGYLPYEGTAWLNKRTIKGYNELKDPIDQSIYIDNIIKQKIIGGKLIDLHSLPPWVPTNLKRVITKATQPNNEKRYPSVASFLTTINTLRSKVPDWAIIDGYPTLSNITSYRICREGKDSYRVEKRRTSNWRKDNSFGVASLINQVNAIEKAT